MAPQRPKADRRSVLHRPRSDLGLQHSLPGFGLRPGAGQERSAGVAFDALEIPVEIGRTIPGLATVPIPLLGRVSIPALGSAHARVSFEYVDHLNYGNTASFRTMLSISIGLQPTHNTFTSH